MSEADIGKTMPTKLDAEAFEALPATVDPREYFAKIEGDDGNVSYQFQTDQVPGAVKALAESKVRTQRKEERWDSERADLLQRIEALETAKLEAPPTKKGKGEDAPGNLVEDLRSTVAKLTEENRTLRTANEAFEKADSDRLHLDLVRADIDKASESLHLNGDGRAAALHIGQTRSKVETSTSDDGKATHRLVYLDDKGEELFDGGEFMEGAEFYGRLAKDPERSWWLKTAPKGSGIPSTSAGSGAAEKPASQWTPAEKSAYISKHGHTAFLEKRAAEINAANEEAQQAAAERKTA